MGGGYGRRKQREGAGSVLVDGKIERKREEENKKKIQRLIDNYKLVKARSLQHFRFNAFLNFSSFGKVFIIVQVTSRSIRRKAA